MRLAIWVLVGLTLVAVFIVSRPDDDEPEASPPTAVTRTEPPEAQPLEPTTTAETETEATPAVPEPVRLTVRIQGGRPVGGIARAQASENESVILVVRSDVADHVHVHGYDLMADVGPGRPARMQFRATLTGRFEIELEDRAQQIAQLTVVP
jgi:hypothetical protein